ncbi:copper chaperone PCu(A)C [[Kitasatospora] papulosa]|uniref:copper chaperone PCu(A)C n=1 Tax=[Kitasatospora] papulosa TaxID=1464011 RepID=UPI00403C8D89
MPVAACSVVLGGLTTWVGAGRAGSPAEVSVEPGSVLLPFAGVPETAAFFRITNSGGSADTLVRVSVSGAAGESTLAQHRMTRENAAYRSRIDSVSVAAGDSLAMSPSGVGLTVPVRHVEAWRAGDQVPFTLEFRHSGLVKATAVVVRPGSASVP